MDEQTYVQAPEHPREQARLHALSATGLLDSPDEADFDDLTALAAQICATPIALVSLVDAQRQWFKSRFGLNVRETPRDVAFCAHALHGNDLLEVGDTTRDHRFAGNPLTLGEPGVRFYAGMPIASPDGLPLGTLCVIDHVPRRLTDGQRDALRRLARQVSAQITLHAARNQAIATARAENTFLATMSHELRTPLNGIVATTQLLAECSLPDDARELVDVLEQSSSHLSGIVDAVLDLARLETGDVALERAPLAPRALAEQVRTMCEPLAKRKGLVLRVDSGHALRDRLGDALRVRQILLNLVTNAVKFTDRGEVTLQLRDRSADILRIEVRDTGIGIEPAAQVSLFQRFFQADPTTARRFGGSGLGLAIVRQLCERMGGRCGVNSARGAGSTFWVELPLDEAPNADGLPGPMAEPADTPLDLRGMRILVADDDATNRLLVKRMLNRYAADVVAVNDGAAAVAACHADAFDLVLMDGLMPNLDGYEASRRIRALPKPWCRTVPIVALTANALPGERARCIDAGMTDHLTKPVRRESLHAALRSALGQARQELAQRLG